jgi:hypothetical protein
MKLLQRYHPTHFMHVMLDQLSLQTPTPQQHKTPNPQNATTARTPPGTPQQQNTYSAQHMLVLLSSDSTSASTSADAHHQAAHPQRFECMSVVPQVMRFASTEDEHVGQDGTTYHNKVLTSKLS